MGRWLVGRLVNGQWWVDLIKLIFKATIKTKLMLLENAVVYFWCIYTGLDKLRARCRSGALGQTKPLRCAQFFGRAHFDLQGRKKTLDLQDFSRIGKTTKKLQGIPKLSWTLAYLNSFITFTYLIVSKLLIYSYIGKYLINCLPYNRLEVQSRPFKHPWRYFWEK